MKQNLLKIQKNEGIGKLILFLFLFYNQHIMMKNSRKNMMFTIGIIKINHR